jgi:hypothetical protein
MPLSRIPSRVRNHRVVYRMTASSRYEPDAPANEFRRGSSIRSLALRTRMSRLQSRRSALSPNRLDPVPSLHDSSGACQPVSNVTQVHPMHPSIRDRRPAQAISIESRTGRYHFDEFSRTNRPGPLKRFYNQRRRVEPAGFVVRNRARKGVLMERKTEQVRREIARTNPTSRPGRLQIARTNPTSRLGRPKIARTKPGFRGGD